MPNQSNEQHAYGFSQATVYPSPVSGASAGAAGSGSVIKSSDIYAAMMRGSSTDETPALAALQSKYQTANERIVPSAEVALRRAAYAGNVDDIEYLVSDYGVDVLATSSNGFSPLDWAYHQNQMEAFDTLCWLGADQSLLKPLLWKYSLDSEPEFPIKNLALCRAAACGNCADIIVLIKRYKADIQTTNEASKTPLQLADTGQHCEAVRLLEGFLNETQQTEHRMALHQ